MEIGVEMGLFGALQGLAGGRGREARPVPMAAGEQETARTAATFRPGTPGEVAGDLVATTMRLVFTPLESEDVGQAVSWVDRGSGATDEVDATVRRHGFGRLADFDRVRAGRGPSRSCPPTVVVTDMVGTEREIGILGSRTSSNGSPANVGARDRMLGSITALAPQAH